MVEVEETWCRTCICDKIYAIAALYGQSVSWPQQATSRRDGTHNHSNMIDWRYQMAMAMAMRCTVMQCQR